MIGLTSVTFRSLPAERIISLAKQAGLDGIEWGGDIHVPPGNASLAANIKAQTVDAGLGVLSYGSYYRLLTGGGFAPVLDTAAALGAPMVRVWAGPLPSAAAGEAWYDGAATELRSVCAMAADHGITVGLEYHRGTLTDTSASTKKLLLRAGAENLSTYWQPNPDLSIAEHRGEITLLLPRISSIHVFHWERDNIKRPLAEGEGAWGEYLSLLGKDRDYIMEFVRDDSEEQFRADAQTLRRLLL
jgi:sugar phosphate isomerase/epimerase